MSNKQLTKPAERSAFLFDDFFRPWGEWFGKELTVPAANITENGDVFKVSLAVPGLKKNDFNINVEGNMLTISSEKEESKDEKEGDYTRKEYSYSSFSRSFTLPEEVNQDKIEASYEDGVLKVTLPKKEEAKKAALSKQIAVR